jgi:DNA-3-methyladenine glycosylase II
MEPAGRRLTNATLALATEALCAQDEEIAAIVQRFGVPPMWGRRPGFPTLVRIILEQQVSLAAARTMYARLVDRTGDVTPESVASLGIPGLRALGFTGQKSIYCHELARLLIEGHLDLGAVARAPDDVGRRALLAVRGLGPWSVDIYYLMALRRPDVWPHGDLALADAVFRTKRMRARPDYDRLTRLASQWRPWRSVAARIFWHHYLSTRAAATGRATA